MFNFFFSVYKGIRYRITFDVDGTTLTVEIQGFGLDDVLGKLLAMYLPKKVVNLRVFEIGG